MNDASDSFRVRKNAAFIHFFFYNPNFEIA